MLQWLHPGVVHFAIGLLFTGVLFDVVGLWRTHEKLVFAGFYCTVLGALGAVVAVVTGLGAQAALGPHDDIGDAILTFHKLFAFAGAACAVVLAGARFVMKGIVRPKFRTLYLTVALLTGAFVTIAGALGGTGVFGYGLGVTRSAAQRVIDAHLALEPPPPARPATVEPVDAGSPVDAGTPELDAGTPDAGAPAKKPAKRSK
jgi:uncharacterized membrane protein